MESYTVTIRRTLIQHGTMTVEATSQTEAEKQAEALVDGNTSFFDVEWEDFDYGYSVEDVNRTADLDTED